MYTKGFANLKSPHTENIRKQLKIQYILSGSKPPCAPISLKCYETPKQQHPGCFDAIGHKREAQLV